MIEPLVPYISSHAQHISIQIGDVLWASLTVSPLLAALSVLGLLLLMIRRFYPGLRGSHFEIDEAEIGVGSQKLRLKPNDVDRQVAYKVWVELSTRKIGLPIDPDHDVLVEVYDSWYSLFSVARELIKEVPVSKLKRADTRKIVCLLIDVLNRGIRPHLTHWQARFRRWYEGQLKDGQLALLHPQDIQKRYPQYDELIQDMLDVNRQLIYYRNQMYELVTGEKSDPLST